MLSNLCVSNAMNCPKGKNACTCNTKNKQDYISPAAFIAANFCKSFRDNFATVDNAFSTVCVCAESSAVK